MARLTSPIFTHLLKVLFAAAGLANTLQPHVRINNRLVRATRDENFIDTPGSPQDLCGESTFEVLEDESGPLRDDCALLHQTVEKNLHGFWVASKMGSDGTVWVEFTRLRSCGLKIRRTDGQSADIPIGDEDVVDLVNDLLNGFPNVKMLHTAQGEMICSKGGSRAAVEWMIFSV